MVVIIVIWTKCSDLVFSSSKILHSLYRCVICRYFDWVVPFHHCFQIVWDFGEYVTKNATVVNKNNVKEPSIE